MKFENIVWDSREDVDSHEMFSSIKLVQFSFAFFDFGTFFILINFSFFLSRFYDVYKALVSFLNINFPKIKSIFSSTLFFSVSSIKLWWEYSATEGADSHPASGAGTPTDEKAGQVGMGKW